MQAVVLGARFGGLAVSVWLRHFYSARELDITVIDQWETSVYRPGLVHAMDLPPMQLMPRIRQPLRTFWKRQRIRFLHDTIVGIDPERRLVDCAITPPTAYDVLFIALGAYPDWTHIPGLSAARGGICEGYLARHTAVQLQSWQGGDFVFAAGPIVGGSGWSPKLVTGCECPLVESALLWDSVLTKQGARKKSTLTILTPSPTLMADAGPRARSYIGRRLQAHDIRVVTQARYVRVDPGAVVLDDRRIPCQGAVWIPPYAGIPWLKGSKLDDGEGWIPTDAFLNHPRYPDIYAVGDCVSHPWPKMGHAAMVQARVAVTHWRSRRQKGRAPAPYRPAFLAVLEIGSGAGLFNLSDTFYGGKQDRVLIARYLPWVKSTFQWAYRRTAGKLPVMP